MDFLKTKFQRFVRRLELTGHLVRTLRLVAIQFFLLAAIYSRLLASTEPTRMERLFGRYHLLLGVSCILLVFAVSHASNKARESVSRVVRIAVGTWLLHLGVYAMVRIFAHRIVPLEFGWFVTCIPLGAIGVCGGISLIFEHLIDD